MTVEKDFLIQSMFERESLDEMTLDELQALSEQYPYSSIIRYLHTSKLKESYHRHYPDAVSKTAMYFSNPNWLHYQLSDEAERGSIKKFMLEEDTFFVEDVEDVEDVEENSDGFENEPYIDQEEAEQYQEEAIIKQNNGIEAELVEIEAIIPENSPVIEEPLAFEPYHTVDYFASQGIRLGVIEEKDELGQKVKSFTAWLKTMKNLQVQPENTVIRKDFNEIEDKSSVLGEKNELIVTEAMAEVYLKQGLGEKAIEIYKKLSLQNPINSHIFADRILEIKENRL
jgi:hypothetical protein